ncbi:hypothetical protein BC332_06904 [Capsicum chinense]|nr:hypothetical protein BC332_06904 [Capsicum chinense]
MEEFFQVSWFYDDETYNNFVVNQSAFVSFESKLSDEFGVYSYGSVSTNHRNMNKRAMEFLKKNWISKNGQVKIEKEKGHKHMIKERIRREKQKQSYLALHKLLPMGTKGEKNAIVQTAASRIEELQKYKENLKKRNDELEMMILAENDSNKISSCN